MKKEVERGRLNHVQIKPLPLRGRGWGEVSQKKETPNLDVSISKNCLNNYKINKPDPV